MQITLTKEKGSGQIQKGLQYCNLGNSNSNPVRYNDNYQRQMPNMEGNAGKQFQAPLTEDPLVSFPQNKGQQMVHQSHPKRIKMPIPFFQRYKIDLSDFYEKAKCQIQSEVDEQKCLNVKKSIGKEKSKKLKRFTSTFTQTEDFTEIDSLFFQQPKIYEIPVQLELIGKNQSMKENKAVQTCDENVIEKQSACYNNLANKIQNQQISAVRRQKNFLMQSGTVNLKIGDFSFDNQNSKHDQSGDLDQKDYRQGKIEESGADEKDSEYDDYNDDVQEGEYYDEELLLQGQNQISNDRKEELFQTARFQSKFHNFQTDTPLKSQTQSLCESSPQTNQMRITEREVNMMQMFTLRNDKIDEQEYESFQSRFRALQEENLQKQELIEELNSKITKLQNKIQQLNKTIQAKQISQQNYKRTEEQLLLKSQFYDQKLKQQTEYFHIQLKQHKNENQKIKEKYEDIILGKQNEISFFQQQLNQFKREFHKVQEKYIKENEALQSIVHEKTAEINELKYQHDKRYDIYIISIKEMKEKIHNYEIKMENLQGLVNKKDQKITQIKEEYKKVKEINFILSEQLQALKLSSMKKSKHTDSNLMKEKLITVTQRKETKATLNGQSHILINQETFSDDSKKQFSNYATLSKRYQKSKTQESSPSQVNEKRIFSQSQSSDMKPQQGKIFLQESNQTNKFVTYSFKKPLTKLTQTYQNYSYIQELEKIIIIYENIIQKKLETIEELQQKVLEFLKDALTKQNEAEFLSSQLYQLENKMNAILIEKMDLQLENKRLKKMITQSENKLSILGRRLIKLAKNNSTISFIERHQNSNSVLEERAS